MVSGLRRTLQPTRCTRWLPWAGPSVGWLDAGSRPWNLNAHHRCPCSQAATTCYSGGWAKYTPVTGASASYTFTGRSVALVTTRAISRGRVNVDLDGAFVTTLSGDPATRACQVLARGKTFVVGTAGRPWVDLGAFAVVT